MSVQSAAAGAGFVKVGTDWVRASTIVAITQGYVTTTADTMHSRDGDDATDEALLTAIKQARRSETAALL